MSLLSAIDKWHEKTLQEGIQKGRQEGKAETLISLLELRFGPLPDSVLSKFNQADEEQLHQWTSRILTAKTLGDIFGN